MRLLTLSLCLLACGCGARTPLYALDDAGPELPVSALDAGAEGALDAPVAPDSSKLGCTDPSSTFVYVITEQAHLYSYRPATASFSLKGTVSCPGTTGTPFSMGVDRKGYGYVVYSDSRLFKVNMANAACEPTSFAPGLSGFDLFGMGFSTDQGGPSERLYLAASGLASTGVPRLGWLDVASYAVTPIAWLDDSGMELTGTGDGRLYGFFDNGFSAHLVQLDKETAGYITDETLAGVSKGQAWAFAFWGGDFWFFTSPKGYSTVTRYQPGTKQIAEVASLPGELIVGAGVSTCAPEQ